MSSFVEFEMTDGIVLSTLHEPREAPRAVVLLIPGFALTCEDYAVFIAALSRQMNAAVYALDLRGQGRSGGRPGDIEHENRLSRDITELTQALSGLHAGRPIWWVAHSSGGSLALRTLDSNRTFVPNGLVLIAPVICGHIEFDRRRMTMHRLRQRLIYGRVLPQSESKNGGRDSFRFSLLVSLLGRILPWAGGLTVLEVSRPEHFKTLAFSSRFFRGYYCKDPAGALERMPCPLWMMIGEEDEYSLPSAVTGLVKWNTAPGRLRAAEEIKGQGHFEIFAVATVLLNKWLRDDGISSPARVV